MTMDETADFSTPGAQITAGMLEILNAMDAVILAAAKLRERVLAAGFPEFVGDALGQSMMQSWLDIIHAGAPTKGAK